ncbi:PREDICTED: protein UNUSUAL FLORAL ORGANS [Ipomoea nil]|uniref:protein UNUSUAL FLORAL ORGANS n=1 Tax=Ipomoea nil TaxID=35883 RepID=UPI0009017F93|nr:PREDICTED: protein UNUSUAL FLORAL ORGANS [Ipomoea nil]
MEAFHSTIGMPFPYGFPTTVMNMCGTTNPMSSTPWMDSRIWSRLPQRLIDRIIAFLPPPAFFRARSVCKRWYSLLFSTTFLELYLQVSPHCHWFIFFKHKSLKSFIYRSNNSTTTSSGYDNRAVYEGYLFDPHTLTWYRLSFPLIPPGFSPATSSGGLIGWVSEEAGSKNILLSNPLVGSLIPIPPTLRPRLFPSIGLNITDSSIDLAVAGDDLISPYAVKNLTTESFHMDANGFYSIWGTTSSLPRLCSFESGEMVYSEGRFYCMNYSPFSVLSYDISSNTWCKIQAPMRRFLRSPSLVESGGRVMMVAAVEKSNLNVPRSLRVWGLQDCGTAWVETERMPQQLYVEFAEIEKAQGFNCVGHGEFVVIMIKNSDKALLFDFSRKRWVWVPPCPFVHQDSTFSGGGYGDQGGGAGGAGNELHGFAYEPRLAAPVTALLHQFTLPFQ